MNWKFWNKQDQGKEKGVKLPKPKDLTSGVGKHLVTKLGYSSDWVWSLKSVAKEKKDQKGIFDFRAYDPATAKMKNVTVLNYTSLDANQELILFEGWYDKNSWELDVQDNHRVSHDQAAS
ncbi:MAG: hypothetical protein KKE44_03810 [Proteobacteria bacterium]|nr:hypothetical protein [Pseudomonadota bacterium]MBU1581855.1 hypothetical protein [Pseudomonadota bacterium]MBU2452558.1 hypothetical protein [Pseudomonadota bacterium]MBU2630174.1 hypothetical protein [Pseudomonadota bacterium]